MSQKINAIVFSTDRAAQLNILLESILKNADDVFKLTVLFVATDDTFMESYKRVISDERYSEISFIEATDLKSQVIEALNSGEKYSCFFLDDDIIYKPISFSEIENTIDSDEDLVCFSLRLGKNTTFCYTLGTDNVMHDIETNENIMKWDWSLHYLDFGYPFSMDGHIYRTKDILKLTKKSDFSGGVDGFEMSLFDYAENFPRTKMASFIHSALVGVPIGRVQVSLDDESAILRKQSKANSLRKQMNDKFLNNNFINLESIDFSGVNGCHQELDLGVSTDGSILNFDLGISNITKN
jgi:hypothetical protein